MAIKGTIVQQREPAITGGGRVDFDQNKFDVLIEQKGYDVIYRKAIQCPCKSRTNSSQSNCKNCGGIGFLWINPVQTKMVMQSMNVNPKYQEYGESLLGTVNISAREVDRLSKMDEITIQNAETESTQVLWLEYNETDEVYYTYTTNEIIETYYVAFFEGTTNPLRKLEPETDYQIEGRKITFQPAFIDSINTNDASIAIRYTHRPKYYIWEIGRDVMNSTVLTDGSEKTINLPVNAIGMKADLVKDLENYNGDRLFDNSFLTKCDV